MIVYACSSNAGKLREFGLVAPEIKPLPGLSEIEAPEETGSTFEANAVLKAVYYSQFTGELVFADDSGLEVDALQGAPGVWSARYAGEDATDADNNTLLLERLNGVRDRGARFVCVIALAQAGKLMEIFHGRVEGEILRTARGANGFGYDPLFFYPPLKAGFGELNNMEKFAVSHRGQAVRGLVDHLRSFR